MSVAYLQFTDDYVTNYETPFSTTSTNINNLESGYIQIRKIADPDFPILDASASPEWFFYSTASIPIVRVPTEENTKVFFISGYAIKRGENEIYKWNIW